MHVDSTLSSLPVAEDTDRPVEIRIDGLQKTYKTERGSVEALSDINLEIRLGEFVSLIGRSGRGIQCCCGSWPASWRPPPDR